jgi:hypothetical protein
MTLLTPRPWKTWYRVNVVDTDSALGKLSGSESGKNRSNLAPDSSVADPNPGSGAFLTPWTRDPGWVRNQDPDPG